MKVTDCGDKHASLPRYGITAVKSFMKEASFCQPLKVHLHCAICRLKTLASATVAVLALASLDDVTQTGLFLLLWYRPRMSRFCLRVSKAVFPLAKFSAITPATVTVVTHDCTCLDHLGRCDKKYK